MRPSVFFFRLALAAGMVCASVGSAAALDTSVSGGVFLQKSGDTTGGVIVSQHLRSKTLHVPGFRTQLSAALPFATGGRYGVTGEIRHGFGNTSYLGGGVGYGRWDRTGRSGALYDLLGGTRIARHTYLEGRLYNQLTSRVGHAGYVGVSFYL